MQYYEIPCNAMQHSGILWHTLAYSCILWHTLAYSGILWHTLACSCILWHNQCIINNCWRSVPLPCGHYMAIFNCKASEEGCIGKKIAKSGILHLYILNALHLRINLDSAEHFCCIHWCVKNLENISAIICFKIRHLVLTTWHRFWNNKRLFRRKSI